MRNPLPTRFIISCALYVASIIIGAGILGLPTLTATVGIIPAVGLTIVLGIILTAVYMRIAAAIDSSLKAHLAEEYGAAVPGIDPETTSALNRALVPYLVERKGMGVIDTLSTWLGFGRAGRAALMVGLVAYVVPAVVLYITSGATALVAIANRFSGSTVATGFVGVGAAVGLVLSFRIVPALHPFTGRGALAVFLQMVGSWLGALGVLLVAPGWKPLPLLLFAAAIGGLVLRVVPRDADPAQDAPRDPFEIEPTHRVGTINAGINLTLLAATGVLAIGVLHAHGQMVQPRWFAPSFDAGNLAKAFGGLLFAFVGTGVLNLTRYPVLFERTGPSGRTGLGTVVKIGTLIPTAAYAGWMVVIAFALDPATLIQTDNARSYATVPLADRLSAFGSAGWLVFFAGYTVALLAVTGAGLGFSESLADRLARIARSRETQRKDGIADSSDAPEPGRTRRWQLGVIALGTGLAVVLQAKGDAFSFRDILSIAGTLGGGMLILILPLFIPTSGHRRSRKREVVLATIIAAGVVLLNVGDLPAGFGHTVGGTIAGTIVIVITAAFAASFIWLVMSEPDEALAPLPVAARSTVTSGIDEVASQAAD